MARRRDGAFPERLHRSHQGGLGRRADAADAFQRDHGVALLGERVGGQLDDGGGPAPDHRLRHAHSGDQQDRRRQRAQQMRTARSARQAQGRG